MTGWRRERVAEVMLGCRVMATDLEALDRMAAQDNVSRADVVRRIIRDADARRQATERQAAERQAAQ